MSKLVGFAAAAIDWTIYFTADVVLLGLGAGVFGLFCGLLAGLVLQVLLHLVGVGPSINRDYSTDWYAVIPGLLGAGAGIAVGVEDGIQQWRRDREASEHFDRLSGGGE